MTDELLDKTVAGRFHIISLLGRGAMAAAYKAIDPVLDRLVAIKIFNPTLEEEVLSRVFSSEGRILRSLFHPNIVRVFDSGQADGRAYIVMELIDGESFASALGSGRPVPLEDAIAIVAHVGDALRHAHAQGFVHGDIKPANILVSSTGRVVLTDFGLASAIGESMLTSSGLVLGTPKYMSPEQAMGKRVDARSDIYSLAVVLHEALNGESWVKGGSTAEILARVVEQPPPSVRDRNPDVPESVDRVLAKALAKSPDDRYQTAEEFLADLRDVLGTGRLATLTPPPDMSPLAVPLESPTGFLSGLWRRWPSLFARRRRSRRERGDPSAPLARPIRDDELEEETWGPVRVSGGLGSSRREPIGEATAAVAPHRPLDASTSLKLQNPAAGSWLLVMNGARTGEQFNLRDVLTIGRATASDVQLPDSGVSRRQAEIVLRDGRFYIRDLRSRLGTSVNGTKVQERELRDRDEIQVGSTTLMFISATDLERAGSDSKRRLEEFDAIWHELARAAHDD